MNKQQQTIAAGRQARDRAATVAINAAGTAVIAVILLILAYLLFVALPLTEGVEVVGPERVELDADRAFIVSDGDGSVWWLPPLSEEARASSYVRNISSGDRALLLHADTLYLFDLVIRSSGPDETVPATNNARLIEQFDAPGIDARSLAFHSAGETVMISYEALDGALHALLVLDRGSESATESEPFLLEKPPLSGGSSLLDAQRGELIHVAGERYFRWQPVRNNTSNDQSTLISGKFEGLQSQEDSWLASWGPGQETVLLASATGTLYRFDPARRQMPMLGPPIPIIAKAAVLWSESARRVTYVLNGTGELEIVVPSSGEHIYRSQLPGVLASRSGAKLPEIRADGRHIVQLDADGMTRWTVNNRFPETGWQSLWMPHRYSAYDEPAFAWHPDGGAIGVLSKFGLTPLLYGTLKAALYGLALSIPLALGAAIYTGYFLSSRRRNQFKPAIEMLEAFPTVVLGFIAGLWLAPLLLDYLALVLVLPLLLVGLPLLLALVHLLLQLASPRFVTRPPRVWLLTLGYLLIVAALLTFIDPLQDFIFQGSARDWLWQHFGLRYEQRNALLVGLAMGIAITPAMFSIIEDAVFAVPRDLSDGSLALGATRWQSLARVVLPAASPAILSAILIGLARGLGETMIVLLATGNTPLMEGDMFSGLRSLSASITAELPEAGATSVHFRVLFLAALVLFGLTFTLNTAAELLRQRLRYAYSSH